MKNSPIPSELLSFSKALNSDIREQYGIYDLNVPEKLGQGTVRCVAFDKYITAIDLNINLNKEQNIPLITPKEDAVYFIYCLDGNCFINSEANDRLQLDKLKTAVIMNRQDFEHALILGKDFNLKLNIVVVDKKHYFKKFLNGYYHSNIKLEKLLESFDTLKKDVHLGAYNLKITEQIRLLQFEDRANDITDLLYLEGIYHLILAYHIEQFYQEIQEEEKFSKLTNTELQQIGLLSEFIISRPEIQHSIDSLCRKAGMSPAKLQDGFKYLHGKTVLNYIRSVRLDKADQLLRDSDLNISEIVYSIGFTSRSYFCKIFKQKYRCTPKAYRKMVRNKTLEKKVLEELLD
ncbi:helix-turn-helix domain-containing protein [Aegicerativicinus sediminis]|uniref:helix-turn-helix domain-containing protein n=1 Tax=Aegicerativicinus sediminis TaxID=2893202 RepID=UPI001E56C808|nr:AraC family transcriptional regulator [Aegicerativicinus sediminis]